MPADNLHLRLSTLPLLAPFLVQRAQTNDDLQAALDDGLEDYTQGAQIILAALEDLLDDYLREGHTELYATDEMLEPFKWLAISEHLAVVQAFRDLL